ncbi:glycine--tRNA ligase [Tenacibaculum finnmarkense]|uniref:Glycine--tRNA ligase n=1 Tax=Tenacibaculum finnmarkense genomovar finnmarkense TaxID=1458503 RepID=A0AAP1WFA5_9FLAO|nr:glycine--tRNA ligase [Tenacibaculum finnmarkense]MBE7651547.1 glycine--tRNA ligase [Tenacibaculum finnmarkense genomovar finnmarkense]MBE7694104.1 glycine--tRNA ligase [Tenacibaculum finnmarkense genomovar finnmarkense]MCD8426614.1 glycine--tRNA ligase [Tenacibaculum finnmarkense genomovar finnmarkense]MCG8730406.1 glycine--tRNA ligase [Tenacibaculum finnmarkense]MCG8750836.1 glycine--tRNA ligase [Tenacibaculum finnmarkense]
MAKQEDHFKKVISHAKEYGYVFQSSEIYDGLSAVYDYAQNGVELKKNIRDYWWKAMVQMHENIVGIDAAILMHPNTWKASGHVDAFTDPLIDNKDSKKRYRADVLVEDYCAKIETKIEKEVKKAEKRFGETFNKAEFVATNGRVLGYQEKINTILSRLGKSLENEDLADVKLLIEELEIADPLTGSKNWTDVKQFNLMFGTKLGASAESAMDLYLRPETAQGIFVNFLNVQKTGRLKIPFGIAQTGKAFRNEIVARQFIFRMREFEQMELQFFVKPGTQKEWYNKWKETRLNWHLSLGMGADNYRFHDHEKLAHYADAAADIEFKFPFGFKELEGIHSRTDFDLKAHEEFSGKKLQYFDHEDNKSYTPCVVETSIGLDRMFLAVFSNSLQEEALENGTSRTVLKLPAILAPVKAAILPLVKKDGLPEVARKIMEDLKWDFNVAYDEKDAVGRRYRRQDANGTPFCITVDHDTLNDNAVTIRHRDTMEQKRVPISELRELIKKEVDVKNWLQKM